MLASISPLGERARGHRWGATAAAFAVGAVGSGATVGVLSGALGHLVIPSLAAATRILMLAVVALAAGLVDLFRPVWVPGLHRQVDEDWMVRYRWWVYGAGYGAQLGLGVVTVVTTAGVYTWMVAAALTTSPLGGLVVGAVFGVARTLPLAVVARVATPSQLRARLSAVAARARPAHRAAGLASVAVGGIGLLTGWVAAGGSWR